MKIKPSTGTLLTNKKTTPPTAGKISKPKSFKAKSKTSLSNKLTSTPCTTPKAGKKELSAHTSSSKKNKKFSPELNLGLKIEKIIENGGPNVIKLSSESDTPKTSAFKKKVKHAKKNISDEIELPPVKKKVRHANKDGTDKIEVSSKSEFRTPKKQKKTKRIDKTEDCKVHNQQKEVKIGKPAKLRKVSVKIGKNSFVQHPGYEEGNNKPSSSDAARQWKVDIDKHLEYEEKSDKPCSSDAAGQCNLEIDKVLSAVNSLKEYIKKKHEESKNAELFDGNTEPVFLQISSVKKATCPKRMLRFSLPHSLVHDLTDICLIVPDIKGSKRNPDAAIEYYQELLAKNNVTNIKEVIPLRVMGQEYSQYEMKRKLGNRFDMFLADSRISHYLICHLGKAVAYTRKHPIPVRLASGDIKKNIQKALSKTQMKIGTDLNSFSVVVGHMSQSAEEISANIRAVAEGLAEKFPGNWPNVRALYIKPLTNIVLPVYISLLSPNSVAVPVIKPMKKKGDIVVEGELSTMLDATVTVKPDGTVIVHKNRTRKSSLSDDEDAEILALAKKHKEEARSAGIENEIKSKSKNKSDKILQKAEEKFVKLYKGNLDDVDIDDDDDDNDGVDGGNVESGNDSSNEVEANTKSKKRKFSTHLVEVKKAKKASSEDEKDGEDEPKVKQKKPRGERVAKTNWIKSTKKGRSKKLSKSQRKAKIKTRNLKNSNN